MNWFPFYSADFLGATIGLSYLERSSYALMLVMYYELERPFPLDKTRCYRLLHAESDEQRRAIEHILREFFVRREDGWYNERAEREIARWRVFRTRASIAGKRGNEVRWAKKNLENLESSEPRPLGVEGQNGDDKPSKGNEDKENQPEHHREPDRIPYRGAIATGSQAITPSIESSTKSRSSSSQTRSLPTPTIYKDRGNDPKRLIPPPLEMVEAFIAEHSYPVNAEKFWNHYQANGWMVGKNRMKDWQAAVRTWAAGARERIVPERNGKLAI